MCKSFFLLIACFLLFFSVRAQDVVRVQECRSDTIKYQVDSLKALYKRDGFAVLKEASITMESEYEMPVIVPLEQRGWYQFVFIGEPSSRLYEVRMFDWNANQVVYQKKMWGDVDGNIISFSYQPSFSEYYMLRPVQVNKKQKKNLCGYVLLLQKVAPAVATGSTR